MPSVMMKAAAVNVAAGITEGCSKASGPLTGLQPTSPVQVQQAALEEQHHADPGDRLGHRIDAENGIGLDRPASFNIPQTAVTQVSGLAAPDDQYQVTRQHALIDIAVHALRDVLEAGGRLADCLGAVNWDMEASGVLGEHESFVTIGYDRLAFFYIRREAGQGMKTRGLPAMLSP